MLELLELDLKDIPTEDLLSYSRWFAQYSLDDLLDALNFCPVNDEKRRSAICEVLTAQGRIFKGDNVSKFTLDGILDVFFSKFASSLFLQDLIFGGDSEYCDDPEYSDIETLFKVQLLKFCTLVVNNKSSSDFDIISFASELNIDLNDTYFLNKLKNDLNADLGCYYNINGGIFVDLEEYDMNNLLSYKVGFSDVIQRRLENVDKIIGKKIKFGCSAIGDVKGHSFFGDDVVEYHVGDSYIPIDDYCFVNLDSLENDEGGDPFTILCDRLLEVDFVEMCKNGDSFMVVNPTYKKNIYGGKPEYFCWLVDIQSSKTGKVYTVSSW